MMGNGEEIMPPDGGRMRGKMTIVSVMLLVLWELALPIVVGTLFWDIQGFRRNLPFWWAGGQMLLWAVFQICCVPMILLQLDFWHLQRLYGAAAAVLAVAALVPFCRRKGWRQRHAFLAGPKGWEAVWWGVFAALLLFQLVQAVRMAYADGDDAYYVALTTITSEAKTMYRKLPYTGGATGLDVRHGLAPFPMWIAHLALASGTAPSTTAHIAVPLMLIAMTYGIFYLLGEKLFRDRRKYLPLFLVFLELLVLFGDYSRYTAENFMIARSRQGKAALGNIIVPMLFLLLFFLFEWLEAGKKIPRKYWVLLASVMTAACLCSTFGALLSCMLLAVAGICGAAALRKRHFLLPLWASCLPCVVFALLYLVNG